MSLVLPSSFYQAAVALLAQLGITPTATNVNLLAAWSYCEKPHTGAAAWQWNNPWNTKWNGYGGVNTTVGCGVYGCVKQYPSRTQGIQASASTLNEGRYPNLVHAIRTSDANLFFQQSGEMATWGSSLSCIHSDYDAMPAPPSQYLAVATSAPRPTNVVVTTIAQHPRISLGTVALLAVGAVVVVESDLHWHDLRAWLTSPANGKVRSNP